ncbi:DNA polymerase II [Candidatus Woesearchaeota archaeon]|nr:DNA polymerase II [Candidatus Woesearchaeota archaeon]
MKAFIVYPTYRIINNTAYIYLFGRLENGESFLTINHFQPYFWIKKSEFEKAKKAADKFNIPFETDKTGREKDKTGGEKIKNFDDEEVVKIILNLPSDVPKLREQLDAEKIECYEADVRFVYRFMIDNEIKGVTTIKGDYKKGNFVNRIYENPCFEPVSQSSASHAAQYEPQLKVLSIDIETNENCINKNSTNQNEHNKNEKESNKKENNLTSPEIISISLYTDNYKKVFIVLDDKKVKFHNVKLHNAMCFDNEKAMLEYFKEQIQELDPDIITGWNVVDFDFAVIRERFKVHKIPFVLGRAEWESSLKIQQDFFKESTADIAGRQVLDGMAMMRSSFIALEDYKLETAAQSILGRGKLIKGDNRGAEVMKLYKTEPQKVVDYNLEDAKLVYDILEKKELVKLYIHRSTLTGMQLDRVSASIASLDSMYLRETKKRGIVCPTSKYGDKGERIKGGFVRESSPGIYDYIIVLDFKSLYPSIIRTFNIDPYSFDSGTDTSTKKGEKGEIVAPNKARFFKKTGILPSIIQYLWEMRDKAKKKKDKITSNAIKITMNSLYGSLANPVCRFFNLDMANAITSYGRYIVQETAKKVEEMGYTVIYGDTDSIFVLSKAKSLEDADKTGKKIQDEITEFWAKTVKEWYKMPSYLELQYEKVYRKFIMPKLRGVDVGAKKRYAGLLVVRDESTEQKGKITEKLDFVGMEFVRRDWTELAKVFQVELLNRIFNNKEVSEYVINFVKDLKKGKYDKLLVYKKELRKGVNEYTKTTPPHVKAARLLDKIDSTIIEYVLTEKGPEPIQNLKSKIDYEHYTEKQLKPIADSILVFFNQNFDDLISGKKQTSLFDY